VKSFIALLCSNIRPYPYTGVDRHMASEVLAVPEEHLAEVIEIIRAGLKDRDVSPEVREALEEWCREETEYLCR